MNLKALEKEYDKLQQKYGAKGLNSIYNGGCSKNPDVCFVFMNPTGKNPASQKEWKGLRAPWIGTKNIWDLFDALELIDKDIYEKIKKRKGSEWTEEFAEEVYKDVEKHCCFITNLGKCTQEDARELPDSVLSKYLNLLEKEMMIIKPKVIILFGNQVSSIVLNQKISVSKVRKQCFSKEIEGEKYNCYSVYYPVGNGRFNIDKSIEDIKWIMEQKSRKNQKEKFGKENSDEEYFKK